MVHASPISTRYRVYKLPESVFPSKSAERIFDLFTVFGYRLYNNTNTHANIYADICMYIVYYRYILYILRQAFDRTTHICNICSYCNRQTTISFFNNSYINILYNWPQYYIFFPAIWSICLGSLNQS